MDTEEDEGERDTQKPHRQKIPTKRTRFESVASINTAECDAEPPPVVRALLITLNQAPGKLHMLPSTPCLPQIIKVN
ncbi:unnamed protein product [Taenia asiatica]|uniref:Uncharacterized protein n=1 Tax=Taenia asiatica TaxID=60517 RepID=A0A0R3VZA8_TAEAS|nr:unnamed protein product [Taenia asiatica]